MRIRIRIENMNREPAGSAKAKPIPVWNRIRDTVDESDLKCQSLTTKNFKIWKTYLFF